MPENKEAATPSTGGPSQAAYRSTPYVDSSWEIVGDFVNQEEFEPLAFEVLTEDTLTIDPMFADYGGRTSTGTAMRAHGNESERFVPTKKNGRSRDEKVEVAAADETVSIDEHNRVLEEMRATALEEGRAAALLEAEERMKGVEERYIAVLEDIGGQLNESIRNIEQQAVGLALQIAEKLVGTIVEINPEYILSIVQEAVGLSGGAAIKSVKVSPQDFEFISLLNLPKQFKEFDGTWNFEADDTVKSGCIVVMGGGEIDYQIDKAWERIRDQVVKVI